MANESIAVYFKPIELGAYYETIVYTDSSGQMQYVSAYASNADGGPTGASAVSGLVSAASDVSSNTASAWGS